MSAIICGTDGRNCTCGAPADTPGGMHHDYCPCNPESWGAPEARRVDAPTDSSDR